ncbi:MAG: hypothetical protein MZW92_42280 [Comamonadaceae bacterium]|nr:hypothetical protein [Comamonadaceae bacterium]
MQVGRRRRASTRCSTALALERAAATAQFTPGTMRTASPRRLTVRRRVRLEARVSAITVTAIPVVRAPARLHGAAPTPVPWSQHVYESNSCDAPCRAASLVALLAAPRRWRWPPLLALAQAASSRRPHPPRRHRRRAGRRRGRPRRPSRTPTACEALWSQGDFVAKGTLIILVIMSMGSWYIIFTKLFEQRKLMRERARRAPRPSGRPAR